MGVFLLTLDKDEKNGRCIVVDELSKGNSFGANIHDLYSDSFFMENGLIGEFAKNIIDDVFSFLVKDYKLYDGKLDKDKARVIIDKIGEPVIKSHLLQLYDEKFKENTELAFVNSEIERLNIIKNKLNDTH